MLAVVVVVDVPSTFARFELHTQAKEVRITVDCSMPPDLPSIPPCLMFTSAFALFAWLLLLLPLSL